MDPLQERGQDGLYSYLVVQAQVRTVRKYPGAGQSAVQRLLFSIGAFLPTRCGQDPRREESRCPPGVGALLFRRPKTIVHM